jgi:enamine deaminase RidA (YjgF/YER057c/UK114 family)
MATEWEMPVTRHDEDQASRSTGRTLFGSGAPWEAAVGYSRADSGLADVVRTRIYVTDISLWEQIGRAHGEVLGHVRPVCTMVEVARLIDPRMLVEIEAEAMTG